MENLRVTLFNGITVLVLALTLAAAAIRARPRRSGNWPLGYYAVALGYAFGFPYSLAPWGVFAGLAISLALRFGWAPAPVRWVELAVFAYIAWRCVALLMMW